MNPGLIIKYTFNQARAFDTSISTIKEEKVILIGIRGEKETFS
jgi:hypothetical protein